MTTWASGVAFGAALVAWWRVTRRGFLWLAAGVVALLGVVGALAGGGAPLWIAAGAGAGAALLSRWPVAATTAFGLASVAAVVSGGRETGLLLALTGMVALGGVTDELLLGHWYLVDPRLPRRPLRLLAGVGIAGLAVDALALVALGALSSADALFAWTFGISAPVGVALMVAVMFSLREPSYTGVMASTGLSYLALLTSLAATTVGRVTVSGG